LIMLVLQNTRLDPRVALKYTGLDEYARSVVDSPDRLSAWMDAYCEMSQLSGAPGHYRCPLAVHLDTKGSECISGRSACGSECRAV